MISTSSFTVSRYWSGVSVTTDHARSASYVVRGTSEKIWSACG